MIELSMDNTNLRPVGYAELVRRYRLEVIPNWHRSMIAFSGTHTINTTDGIVEEVYPVKYWPGEELGDHLEFALKYDGVNLEILVVLFEALDEKEMLQYVASKPTGKYARRIWYLFEFLTAKRLPLDNLSQGNYVDILDPDRYYTVDPAQKIQRQRVNDNLLGKPSFCATIRRTEKLEQFEHANFHERVQKIISAYSIQQLKRALSYLYTKETKSSFEIEKVKASSSRTERFITLLQLAETEDFCQKTRFIELQNRIVDPRFLDSDYRSNQNYVGETVALGKERIHYICPKPEDIVNLMDGLVDSHELLDNCNIPPVIHATVIAYGFVFLHPFEDGNGRIHRFLIHNSLARRGFINQGIMFPVSAAMLNNLSEYDQSLEAFSKHIMSIVDYTLNEDGSMVINNDTARWYRYIDMTPQAEALCWFIEKTIDTELVVELEFLAKYDEAKNALQEIIDMPDQKIDLFIRLCVQNRGKLSEKKRKNHFDLLTDDEIIQMESIIKSVYGN
ncbi:MAG: Fic family protein [Candidatus Electryoneaceae bacterium]|nr:Fic family protein [Candidatus Electryoneaceae bacterium]